MKHNYDKENVNKGRGRPKKEFEEKIYLSKMNKKYNKFLDQEKKGYEYIISFTELENIFTLLFNNYKNDIFTTSDKIEKNPFYSLLKENWEKEVPNLDKESYNSMLNCIPPVLLVNKPPIDVVLFKYLKYATKIFDKEYFLFVFKFIILFRQYVNLEKKASVNIKYIKSNKREYTQLYDASIIPDFFNDFIVNFMENRNYFDLNKDKDGYIKYCWSFGNDGRSYLYGKDIEPLKEAQHNFIVFGRHSNILKKYSKIYTFVTSNDIYNRMIQTKHFFKKIYKIRSECPQLERIARCPQLERIVRCSQLERIDTNEKLEISNINYTDYKYQEGDIVYLDPPYEGTQDYGNVFGSKQFYDWCISRPYQVWFSSYKISDKRFRLVYARELFNSLNSDNVCFNFECLYTNK